jgi:hypothetical protein
MIADYNLQNREISLKRASRVSDVKLASFKDACRKTFMYVLCLQEVGLALARGRGCLYQPPNNTNLLGLISMYFTLLLY